MVVAAVTAILKRLLENSLSASGIGGDVIVTALPPDRIATGADERSQLNLFLYQLTPHTRLRPKSLARERPPSGAKLLSLDLYYLLTAYGAQELQMEQLLDHAVQRLFQETPLGGARIGKELAALASENGPSQLAMLAASPGEPIEEIVIEPQFPSGDELFRLWSALQARYRPSIVYKISLTIPEREAQ